MTTPADDRIVRRIHVRGNWRLDTVAHFGGGAGGADMSLERDPVGRPLLAASTQAGAAADYLLRRCQSWGDYVDGNTRPEGFYQLMGGGASEQDALMSGLLFSDSVATHTHSTIRDGVRLDGARGSAADKGKFDLEVIPAGTMFPLRFELLLRHGDPKDEILTLLAVMLEGFKGGDIRLGAKTSRGYGRGRVESWDVRDLEMSDPLHVLSWLRGSVWSLPPVGAKWLETTLPDDRHYLKIEAFFKLKSSLMIREEVLSSGCGAGAPDNAHLRSGDDPVTSGTSIAGTLRDRLALICHALGWDEREVMEKIAEMMGPESTPGAAPETLWKSRLRVEETLVESVEAFTQHRIAIDRFHGGVADTALFTEQPVQPAEDGSKHVHVELHLEQPEQYEVGLLLLALRDLWQGRCNIGGEGSIGRGYLEGVEATVTLQDDNPPVSFKITSGFKFAEDEEVKTLIEKCISSAVETDRATRSVAATRNPRTRNDRESDG